MGNDPFQVLGVSPSATEDEIKAAYRRLAKQYHPDLNPGSATAEAKMKEINEAYSEAIRMKKGGGAYQADPSGNNGGQGGYGGGYRPASGPQAGWDPFGGFWGFGGQPDPSYGASHAHTTYASPEMQSASDYIQTGRYQDALVMLGRLTNHDAAWHYLYALANVGLGNRIAALNSARQAVQMEPDNPDYQSLFSQLEGVGDAYRQRSSRQDFKTLLCSNPCVTCCLANTLINCFCRGCWC